jgi:hypothetical protein
MDVGGSHRGGLPDSKHDPRLVLLANTYAQATRWPARESPDAPSAPVSGVRIHPASERSVRATVAAPRAAGGRPEERADAGGGGVPRRGAGKRRPRPP